MSEKKIIRCKNMMYEQQIEHLPTKDVDNLVKTIEEKLDCKRYAVIVHDKDIDDKGNLVKERLNEKVNSTFS